MTPAEVILLVERGIISGIPRFIVSTDSSKLNINGKVTLPITGLDCSTDRGVTSDVLDQSGGILGTLCFTKGIEIGEFSRLTEDEWIALVHDASIDEVLPGYVYKSDYLLLPIDRYDEYLNIFSHGSAVWGGFIHTSGPATLKRNRINITARPGMVFPTGHHQVTLAGAVLANSAADRFLKYYHLLELVFDLVTVKRIKGLGDDISGIGKLLSKYEAGDLPRLKELVQTYCQEKSGLEMALSNISTFLPTAKEIFNDYSKDGNPLKEKWEQFVAATAGGLTFDSAKREGLVKNEAGYLRLLQEVSSYFIFRVRCSTAHRRIGEYLLAPSQDDFILGFAEPLLCEMIFEVFSNSNLKALF